MNHQQLFQRYLAVPAQHPAGLEIASARGIYLFTPEGEPYVDLVSGVSVSNLGHSNPRIMQAVERQLKAHTHLMVYGEMVQAPQVLLAKRLSELLPSGLDQVYFVSSGSEAIEGALKLARRVTNRPKFISCIDAYHGGTMGALSLLGNEQMKNAFRPLIGPTEHLVFNDFDELSRIDDQTAAVVVEPIQAEAGIVLPAPHYLQAMRERCDQTGALLVFDEIQMGFGRTAKLFSFNHAGVVPDILCLAKALGAGLPLGAFISSAEHMKQLTFNPELGHITTFGGHPLSCAAAMAGLDILMDDGFLEHVDEMGLLFQKGLENHRQIKEIRRAGLMLGVTLIQKAAAGRMVELLFNEKMIADRFLFNADSFRIAPPLIINKDEVLTCIQKINKCLDQL